MNIFDQFNQRLESNHYYGYIVKTIESSRSMQHLVHRQSYYLMHSYPFVYDVPGYSCPNNVMHLLSGKFIENTITASKNVIKFFAPVLLKVDIWVTHHHRGVPTQLWFFGLQVSKSTAD